MEDNRGVDPHYGEPSSGSVDTHYLINKLGILKILEIVLLLIAFASLTGYTGNTSDVRFNDRYNFFYFATVTSWLLVIVIFLVFLVRLNRRVNLNWNLVLMVYSVVTAFLLLLASALVLDAVIAYRGEEEFKQEWNIYCKLEKCGNIEAAGAFGIISTVAFIIDAVFFFMENRTSRAAPPPGAETF